MLDPVLYRWGVPPVVIRCVHWTMQMWVLQTWITAQGLAIIMLLAICAGNSPGTDQWRGALMFAFICVWINGWVNNREAGGLRRYRAHYDVTIMCSCRVQTRNNVIRYIHICYFTFMIIFYFWTFLYHIYSNWFHWLMWRHRVPYQINTHLFVCPKLLCNITA